MSVEYITEKNALRVLICGDIDHHSAKDICKNVDTKLYIQKPQKMYLDFKNVTFMDSSGLAVVVGRKKVCDLLCCKMYISNIDGYPKKILKMSGVDKLIEFTEDENEK